MACFWQGILRTLTPEERTSLGSTPDQLRASLKQRNRRPARCRWQGSVLSEQELGELETWIREDVHPTHDGHDTSTCDPYLCLLVELLCVDIEHNFNGHRVQYSFSDRPARTLHFRSNRGHFW